MKTLPDYISCITPELALAIASFLKEEGWNRSGNLNPNRGITSVPAFGGWCVLKCNKDNKTVSLQSSETSVAYAGYPAVTSLKEFRDLLIDPPIEIGEYTAELRPDGVQVGCTFVPWSTVEELLARRPKA